VEKFFQLVESSFKHEASLLIAQSKINNLDDLNRYFFAWVDRFYNQKIHSSTKQAPLIRWQKSESPLRLKSLDEIHLAFLMEKQVSVSKTGVFRLENNEYEVEPGLAGRRISIRYDPYDLTSGIRVFFEDREFPEAIPAKVRRHHHKNYGPQLEEPAPLSGINHLELLNDEQLGLNFSDLEGLS
jgi:hypothetical protein